MTVLGRTHWPRKAPRRRLREAKALLGCGIAYPVAHTVAHDVIAASQYEDYEDVCGRGRRLRVARLTAAAVPALYGLWIRPRMLTWGASPDETAGLIPATNSSPIPTAGRRWPAPSSVHREGVGLAGADGTRPPGVVQLRLGGQQRSRVGAGR